MSKLHLWVGLPTGIIVFWVALSGALLAFQTEIREALLYPSPAVEVKDRAQLLSPDALKATLLTQVTLPAERSEVGAVEYQREGKPAVLSTGDRRKGQTLYYVNPYDGRLLATYHTDGDIFRFIMRGHRWLWLDREVGGTIVGTATLLFILILISGIVLWLPKKVNKKSLKHALKLNFKGALSTVMLRWHSALGLYLVVFALIFCLTGLTWSFDWYRTAYYGALGQKQEQKQGGQSARSGKADNKNAAFRGEKNNRQSKEQVTDHNKPDTQGQDKALVAPSGSTAELWVAALHTLPVGQTGKTTFSFPTEKDAQPTVSHNPSAYRNATRSSYVLKEGKLEAKQSWDNATLADKVARSTYDIHTGGILGFFGHALAFLACIGIASLPVTGLIIWIRRKRR